MEQLLPVHQSSEVSVVPSGAGFDANTSLREHGVRRNIDQEMASISIAASAYLLEQSVVIDLTEPQVRVELVDAEPVMASLAQNVIAPETEADNQELLALIREHEGLVRKIAGKYAKSHPDAFDDLLQEGMIGLIEAYGRYDQAQGSFRTFAGHRIHGAIIEYIREEGSRRGMFRHIIARQADYEAAVARLADAGNRSPSIDALVAESGMSRRMIQAQLDREQYANPVGLEQPLPGTEDKTYADIIASAPDMIPSLVENPEDLSRAIDRLAAVDKRMPEIVRLHMGMTPNTKTLELKEIGEIYGVTGSRVGQLWNQALRLLWGYLQ